MVTRFAILAVLLIGGTARAEGVGHATVVEGSVSRASGSAPATALKEGDSIAEGDHLLTGPDGRLEVLFDDGSVMRLGTGSDLTVTSLSYEPQQQTLKAKLHLVLGKLWSHVEALQHQGSYEVETDRAVAGVRGTEFRVDAQSSEGSIEVYEGRVAVAELIAMRFTPGGSDTAMAMVKPHPGPPPATRAPAAAASESAAGAVAMAPPPPPTAASAARAMAKPAPIGHSDADMKRALGGTQPEKIVEPNQHLDFGGGGMRLAALRAPDEFDTFVHRARPTRDALHRHEKRDVQKPKHEKRERRHERLERLRWRK